MTEQKTTLGYWGIRGLGQVARFMLTEAVGQDGFVDHYVDGAKWFGGEKAALPNPFPNLPYLRAGELVVTESKAILLHLARKHGLYGATEEEQTRVDNILFFAEDIRAGYAKVCYTPPGQAHADARAAFEKNLGAKLERLQEVAAKRTTKYLVTEDKPTVADFFVYELIFCLSHFAPGIVEPMTPLQDFRRRMEQLPSVATTQERTAPLPFNGPSATWDCRWENGKHVPTIKE